MDRACLWSVVTALTSFAGAMMAATAQPSAALASIVPADEDQHEEQENGAAGNDGNENVGHGVLSGSVSNLVRLYGYPNHKRPAKNRNHGPVPAHRLLTIALDQFHGLAYDQASGV